MNYKNVLITGVAGFMASHLLRHFVKKYPQTFFVGVDKISYCSHEGNFEEIKDAHNFKFYREDITQIDSMDKIFNQYSFDAIFHLGAYTHVDHSFGNSLLFTINNVMGTHILLELSKKYHVKRFIHMSTDEIYGTHDKTHTEESLHDPTNPYAATKAAAEHLVKSYFYSFKLPIIIIRCNNTYGENQFPEKVIPKFILLLLKGKKCPIQGSGNQLRAFLYIEDFIRAVEIIFEKGLDGEIYNISSQDEITINKLHQIISTRLNLTPDDYVDYIQDRDFNDLRYHISSEKLQKLGWKQEIFFDQGLQKTIEWYKSHQDYWSPEQLGQLLM